MKKYIIIGICLLFHKNYAEQFIYPVADFEDGNQLIIIYQKSLQDIELWIWNTTHHYAFKGLSSFITPANLRILPSGKGFSFIDSGYIKIKEFEKRSAKTLPLYEPIDFFSSMNWIDDETFYFVAREGDFFQIFQTDIDAQHVQRLTYNAADALYPQKVASYLFYLQRDQTGEITIIRQCWNPIPINTKFTITPDQEIILKPLEQQLCFLKMIDEYEGFYIQAPEKKIKNHESYEFCCYHILQIEKKWVSQKLFNFKIPAQYVTGSERLYESIEPFLPNYTCKNFIYFVSWDAIQTKFDLLIYNILEKTIESATDQSLYRNQQQKIFAPYIQNNKIYCGFILDNDDQYRMFATEQMQFQLPQFSNMSKLKS